MYRINRNLSANYVRTDPDPAIIQPTITRVMENWNEIALAETQNHAHNEISQKIGMQFGQKNRETKSQNLPCRETISW